MKDLFKSAKNSYFNFTNENRAQAASKEFQTHVKQAKGRHVLSNDPAELAELHEAAQKANKIAIQHIGVALGSGMLVGLAATVAPVAFIGKASILVGGTLTCSTINAKIANKRMAEVFEDANSKYAHEVKIA